MYDDSKKIEKFRGNWDIQLSLVDWKFSAVVVIKFQKNIRNIDKGYSELS